MTDVTVSTKAPWSFVHFPIHQAKDNVCLVASDYRCMKAFVIRILTICDPPTERDRKRRLCLVVRKCAKKVIWLSKPKLIKDTEKKLSWTAIKKIEDFNFSLFSRELNPEKIKNVPFFLSFPFLKFLDSQTNDFYTAETRQAALIDR